ncbi:MAG: hypothetical protein J5725_02085 [Bacteroidales bacterium]|nr:hypothetical protein [Bacteroidales bacterium]
MEYVVIVEFTDKDTKQKYLVGERYPHKGFVNKARAEELSTDKNRRGKALIAVKAEKVEKAEGKPEKAEKSESAGKKKGSKK